MKRKIILVIIFFIVILLLTQFIKIRNSYLATMSVVGYKDDTIYTSGSGFVYKFDTNNAYVVTNYHVIENSDVIYLENVKNKTCKATVWGYDNYFDIAILKTDKKCMLSQIEISKSNKKNIALTIPSNKSENYKNKILFSKIINEEKIVSINDSNKSLKVIELNSKFNYGNSGSPVIDLNGKLQGMLTLKSLENENGYAINTEDIHYIVNFIEKNRIIKRKNLGLTIASTTNKEILNLYGINYSVPEAGVIVLDVNNEVGDIKKGDIIIKINNQRICDSSEYQYYISKYILQNEIIIEYYRENKLNKIRIKI